MKNLNVNTIKYVGFSIIFIVISISLTKNTIDMLKNTKRLEELENEVLSLEQEKEDIEKRIEYKKTDEYVEDFARNELNLIKPGEEVYVVVQNEENDNTVTVANTTERRVNTKPYEQWLNLLF